jgi:hypothetical protein
MNLHTVHKLLCPPIGDTESVQVFVRFVRTLCNFVRESLCDAQHASHTCEVVGSTTLMSRPRACARARGRERPVP